MTRVEQVSDFIRGEHRDIVTCHEGLFVEKNSFSSCDGSSFSTPICLLWIRHSFLWFFSTSSFFQHVVLYQRVSQNLTYCSFLKEAVYLYTHKTLDIMRKSGAFSKNRRKLPKIKK